MLNTDSWKKKAAAFEVSADILFITEHTFYAIKTPFAHEDAAQAAVWLLIHLLQMEKAGSMLCDLALLPSSLRLWLPPEQPGKELIEYILCHYPAVLDNADFISHDPLDAVPVIRVGERFLYLRRNYLLEHQFWQLFSTQFLPNMGADHLGLALSASEIEKQLTEENPALSRALDIIHNSNFLLLTGGPGSGKTFTLAAILKSLISKARQMRPNQPLKIILAAPTGRAQARMIESLHKNENLKGLEEIPQEGQTLHSLLHYHMGTLHSRPPQLLYADIVAVDEASMIDLNLFHRLLQALPAKTKLILIGDPNQLPSVELGAVLADMLRMPSAGEHLLKDHIVELQGSRRSLNQDIDELARLAQSGRSADFHRFLLPSLPPAAGHNVTGIINTQPLSVGQIIAWLKKQYAQASSLLTQSFTLRPDEMTKDSSERELLEKFFQFFDSLCILCARKDNHPLSVEALNHALSPKHAPGTFSHGMPIMVRKNMDEYQLTNGERGILLQIQNQLLCCFRHTGGSGYRTIPLNILFDCIDPCYAMTIHKSQGSEFDHVIIILPDHCEMLMSRALLFTAITRAKHSLMILSDLKTLDLSLREDIGHISCLSYLFAGQDPAAQKMPQKNVIKDEETGQLGLF